MLLAGEQTVECSMIIYKLLVYVYFLKLLRSSDSG